MYGSWDTEWDKQRHTECERDNFLSFWTIFKTHSPNTPKKSKFWKNEKKHLEMLSFYIYIYMCTINDSHMMHEMWSAMDRFFCHFELFFALIPPPLPSNQKNQNSEKLKTLSGDNISFYTCVVYQKWQSYVL